MWKVVRNDGVTQPTRQPPSLIFESSAPMFLAFVSLWQPQPSTPDTYRRQRAAQHDIHRTNALIAAPLIHTCEQCAHAKCAHTPHAHPNLHEPPLEFFSRLLLARRRRSQDADRPQRHFQARTRRARQERVEGTPSSRSLSSEASARKESLERARPKFRQLC